VSENGAITAEIVPAAESLVLMPVMNIAMAKQRLAEFQAFIKEYLVPDEDFGTIPGTPKPTLLKPGADKLCEIYGMSDEYIVQQSIERFDTKPELFDYTVKCILKTKRDGRLVGEGLGSCNSFEGKYLYRDTKRKCPMCGKETIIRGQEQYGGGWLCWKKKDGCGAKFLAGDKAIEDQKTGKEFNEDIPTQKNTILKMAKKRAKIDAVIAATRSSGIFTQDMEDIVDHDTGNGAGTREAAQAVGKQKILEMEAKKNNGVTQAQIPTGGINLPPVPPAAPPEPKAAEAGTEYIHGIIKRVLDKKTKDKRDFKEVGILDQHDKALTVSSFDNFQLSDGRLWQYLTPSAVDKLCTFVVAVKESKGKTYYNIINVELIGDHSWENGVGVVQRREPGDEYEPQVPL
jgi:hypothetical protein